MIITYNWYTTGNYMTISKYIFQATKTHSNNIVDFTYTVEAKQMWQYIPDSTWSMCTHAALERFLMSKVYKLQCRRMACQLVINEILGSITSFKRLIITICILRIGLVLV